MHYNNFDNLFRLLFLMNLSLIKPIKVVIKTAPVTIIKIVQGINDLSILNITLTLNQLWKGRPIPSKTAKKIIFLDNGLPFIFFIWLLTNSLNKPSPQPTKKNINKKNFIPSFNKNAFEIKTRAIKNVHIITIYDFFNVSHLNSFYI